MTFSSGDKTSASGVRRYEWQPTRVVVPVYELQLRDQGEWEEFGKRARKPADWQRTFSYEPAAGEPDRDRLKAADIWFWVRADGELWFLIERTWHDFPDPKQYGLVVFSEGRAQQFGNFGVPPDGWNLPGPAPAGSMT